MPPRQEPADGVILGAAGSGYHIEFTRAHSSTIRSKPNDDDLLVFYLPELDHWRVICTRLSHIGFAPVPSHNPYWDRTGKTYKDPDGHPVVIQQGIWPPRPCPDE